MYDFFVGLTCGIVGLNLGCALMIFFTKRKVAKYLAGGLCALSLNIIIQYLTNIN